MDVNMIGRGIDWTALGTWATALVATGALIAAIRDISGSRQRHAEQMKELRDEHAAEMEAATKARESASRPSISIQRAQFTDAGMRLWIQNIGAGPAFTGAIKIWASRSGNARLTRAERRAADERLRRRAFAEDVPDIFETFRGLSANDIIAGQEFELVPGHQWPDGGAFGFAVWQATCDDIFGNNRVSSGGVELEPPVVAG